MNILILHAHTANRGDEAAVKAMIDELLVVEPNLGITICINGNTFYPNMPPNVRQIGRMPKLHSKIALVEFYLFYATNGKLCFSSACKEFKKVLKSADLILHAPGGPSIGDIYSGVENLYLLRLDLARKLGIPYMFYAPSMGPFKSEQHNSLRRKVLLSAQKIILRDPISVEYLKDFLPEIKVDQAMDSALQHDINISENKAKYEGYSELRDFIENHKKCIGITITDLKWHPKHKLTNIVNIIPKTFQKFIDKKIEEGYGIVYIPQLYGANDDTTLMCGFMRENHTFMIDASQEQYDSYFQQYVIGKLYAVVGMRYHSNIFSAKMGTPFVSVSYEQKMKGFMKSIGLEEYCLDIKELSENKLNNKFSALVNSYDDYKGQLEEKHEFLKQESYKSTKAVFQILEG